MSRWWLAVNLKKSAAMATILLVVAGCASLQARTELHNGRTALLRGMPLVAIPHLEQAATMDGELGFPPLGQSAWTYLGRANYEVQKYPPARQALEQAIKLNRDDGLAKLYLGLTLLREGNPASGQQELLGGLRNLAQSLDFIVYNTASGVYWDPGGKIRRDLSAAQIEVAAAHENLDKLISRLESIGASLDEEIDQARRDESVDFRRNSRDGM